jgi:hypothetical protein
MPKSLAMLLILLFVYAGEAAAQQPKPLKEIVSPEKLQGFPQAFIIAADGKWFARSDTGELSIYSLPDAKSLLKLKLVGTHKLAVSADGAWFAVSADDPQKVTCQTHIYSTKDWKEQKVLPLHERWRFGGGTIALSPEGKYLAIAEANASGGATYLEVIEIASGKTILGHALEAANAKTYPARLQFSGDSKRLMLMIRKFELIDLETSAAKTLKEYEPKNSLLYWCTWSEKLGMLITGEWEARVVFYSDATGEERSSFQPFGGRAVPKGAPDVSMVAASRDGKYLTICGKYPDDDLPSSPLNPAYRIRVYDQKGKLLAETQPGGRMEGLSASLDGRYLMTRVVSPVKGRDGVWIYEFQGVK